MGFKKYDKHMSAAVKEKDERIEYLEVQVQAYAARISHINTRLISTLDALDDLQAKHRVELDMEIRAKERLSEKLDRYIEFTRVAEVEKDDMREAVSLLVEKVELSNDYSLWPHSRIRCTDATDTLELSAYDASKRVTDDELQAYAAAMIKSLQDERNLERRAHEQTRRHAESRILELKAQIARRDAELEACLIYDKNIELASYPSQNAPLPQNIARDVPCMKEEEALQVMGARSAQNKALEQEVRGLAQILGKARVRAASLVKTPTDVPDPSLAGKSPSPSTVPASPILPGPAEAAAQSASSAAPQGSIPCAEDDEDTIRVHPPALKSPDLQSQPIRDLDRQIEALASEVDAFKIERKRLANFVQKKQQDGVQQADTGQFEKVLLIEEECIRLANSERQARAELETCKKSAIARERELQDEIDRLRRLMRRSSSGEQSMDLATPLHASTLLPEDDYLDPPSISLPPSPSSSIPPPQPAASAASPVPLPTLSGSFADPWYQAQSSFAQGGRIRDLEDKLAVARRDVEEKNTALHELRIELEGLRIRGHV